jgi:hypothetical protein
MDEIAVIEVNAILKLVIASRLSDQEIVRLDKAGQAPADLCGYYDTTATLLGWRSAYDNDTSQQLDLLVEIATTDGCEVTRPAEQTPDVNIPIFGGGF